jgi:hypothetical protein
VKDDKGETDVKVQNKIDPTTSTQLNAQDKGGAGRPQDCSLWGTQGIAVLVARWVMSKTKFVIACVPFASSSF